MNTELVTIPKESALQVFTTVAGLDPYLAQVRAEIDAFRPNLETKGWARDAMRRAAGRVGPEGRKP